MCLTGREIGVSRTSLWIIVGVLGAVGGAEDTGAHGVPPVSCHIRFLKGDRGVTVRQ
jgi:hypothetical protein